MTYNHPAGSLARPFLDGRHWLGEKLVYVKDLLLYYVATELVEEFSRVLHDIAPQWPSMSEGHAIETLRRAAYAIAVLPGGRDHDNDSIYNACNAISTLPYEGKPCLGTILFGTRQTGVESVLEFRPCVPLAEHRTIRKYLEMSSPEVPLFATTDRVYGLAKPPAQDNWSVRFRGHGVWELSFGIDVLMCVRNGIPEFPRAPFDGTALRKAVLAIDQASDVDYLIRAVGCVLELRHGALLIVVSDGPGAVAALGPQGGSVYPVRLDIELMGAVTAIDGAVVLDVAGTCHAVGAILDGVASPRETRGRGSRYRSAVRYVDKAKGTCLGLVVSEDGMVDLITFDGPRSSA